MTQIVITPLRNLPAKGKKSYPLILAPLPSPPIHSQAMWAFLEGQQILEIHSSGIMLSPQTLPKLGVRMLQHLIDQNYHRRCREKWPRVHGWGRFARTWVLQGSLTGGFLWRYATITFQADVPIRHGEHYGGCEMFPAWLATALYRMWECCS